jgi:hypothetical protein
MDSATTPAAEMDKVWIDDMINEVRTGIGSSASKLERLTYIAYDMRRSAKQDIENFQARFNKDPERAFIWGRKS